MTEKYFTQPNFQKLLQIERAETGCNQIFSDNSSRWEDAKHLSLP